MTAASRFATPPRKARERAADRPLTTGERLLQAAALANAAATTIIEAARAQLAAAERKRPSDPHGMADDLVLGGADAALAGALRGVLLIVSESAAAHQADAPLIAALATGSATTSPPCSTWTSHDERPPTPGRPDRCPDRRTTQPGTGADRPPQHRSRVPARGRRTTKPPTDRLHGPRMELGAVPAAGRGAPRRRRPLCARRPASSGGGKSARRHSFLPCVIPARISIEDEARTFVDLNTRRQKLSQHDIYTAMLAAGDPVARRVAELLEQTGWRSRRSNAADSFAPGDLACAPLLTRLVARHGHMPVSVALQAIRTAYPSAAVTAPAPSRSADAPQPADQPPRTGENRCPPPRPAPAPRPICPATA